jgi:hypothetical protein
VLLDEAGDQGCARMPPEIRRHIADADAPARSWRRARENKFFGDGQRSSRAPRTVELFGGGGIQRQQRERLLPYCFSGPYLVFAIAGPITHSLSRIKPLDRRMFELLRGTAEQRNGLFQFSPIGHDPAEVVMRSGIVRLERERPPIARHRVIEPVLVPQRAAEVSVHDGIVGCELERGFITGQRIIRPAQIFQHVGEIIVGFGEIGPQFDRSSVDGRRFIKPLLRLQRAAEIKMQAC